MSGQGGTLGIIGTGRVGTAVAKLAVGAGLSVALSNSRGPHSLQALVSELGSAARATTPVDAALSSDIVLASVPFYRYSSLPADALEGRLVLDAMNYDASRDGDAPAELIAGTATTSELVQRHLPGARVAKVFNTIFAAHLLSLARPANAPDRSALPISADSPKDRLAVSGLLNRLGWDAVDAGVLVNSWRMALGQPAFVLPYMSGTDVAALDADPGSPCAAADVRVLLAAAER